MATNVETNGDEYCMRGIEKILHKDLSYRLQGMFFNIRNNLGSGHKEAIYQKAFENSLIRAGLTFMREPAIKIFANDGAFLGLYRPDFLVDDKIIVEFKAVIWITRQDNARVYDYLRNSQYELAYLVNFASKDLYIRRVLYTNDRKSSWLQTLKIFVAISILFVGIRGLPIRAAIFMMGGPQSAVNVGEEARINIGVDTEGERINLFNMSMVLPDGIEFIDFSRDESIVSVWVKEPNYEASTRTISLIGGVPGGSQGRVVLASARVKPKLPGTYRFMVSSNAEAYLNDGFGTPAPASFMEWSLTVAGSGALHYSWIFLIVFIIGIILFWYLKSKKLSKI